MEIINQNGKDIVWFDKNLPKLRKSQKLLYDIICKKIVSWESINYVEMEELYFCKIARNKDRTYLNYYHNVIRDEKGNFKEFESGYDNLSEKEQETRVKTWVMRTIGVLVIKGYLKILPTIKF